METEFAICKNTTGIKCTVFLFLSKRVQKDFALSEQFEILKLSDFCQTHTLQNQMAVWRGILFLSSVQHIWLEFIHGSNNQSENNTDVLPYKCEKIKSDSHVMITRRQWRLWFLIPRVLNPVQKNESKN